MPGVKKDLSVCPECGGHRVGRIASNVYYCSDCCVELNLRREQRKIDVFEVDEEGNLVALGSYRFEQLDRPPVV
ncbi:MAG TPA: hypothetical protein VIL95_04795 [Bacillota bacterium]